MTAPEEEAAALLTAALGTGHVGGACSAALRALLPGSTFVRASVRCGTALLVSNDLLCPGPTQLSVASLQHSLAGLAMVQQQPVVVAAPNTTGGTAVREVLCFPAALKPVSSTGSPAGATEEQDAAHPPLCVGALMVGCVVEHGSVEPAPAALWAAVQALADAAAPYLLLLGVDQAEEMAGVLCLRASDCSMCGDEEDAMQDLPMEACAPPPPPGGSAGGMAGALAAAAAQAAAAGVDAVPSEGQTVAADAGQRLQAAAAATALSKHSSLAAASGSSSSGAASKGASAAAGTSQAQQGTQPPHCQGQEEDLDPKAAVKARLAGRVATSPPPAQPRHALLHFLDPAMEARFAAAHNRSLLSGDTLFAAVHLSAALCVAVLHPAAMLASRPVQIFAAALLAPVLARVLNEASYQRHRELLMAFLLLVHASLLRSSSVPSLLRLLPQGTVGLLPWVRGAEALAVFATGFKLRFQLFLPVQALCLAILFTALQLPCDTLAGAGDCLPQTMRLPGTAVLCGLGGLLPAAVLYRSESRARHRFLAAEHHMSLTAA